MENNNLSAYKRRLASIPPIVDQQPFQVVLLHHLIVISAMYFVRASLIFLSLYNMVCWTEAKRVKRIVGGVSAAPPPPDDPVVFARLYSRNARVEGFRDSSTGLYSFLGIHYAEPPVGNERFLRPRYRSLHGDVNATQFGVPCPQPSQDNANYVIGSEDCLWLNVFTPKMPDESTGLPVVVFIHGGGFRYGSANQYGPEPMTRQQVVFVPIQYRLGTLGIIGDGTTEFSGNVALFDMAAAVRWVHEYIEFFGGDPKQISIIGHGSGATSAIQLSMSDEISSEMITGVVAMSGSAYTKYQIDDMPVQSVKQIASINGCDGAKNEIEIVKCLRKIDAGKIILRDSQVQWDRLQGQSMMKAMTGMVGFGPAVGRSFDDRALPTLLDAKPEDRVKSGTFKAVPLLTGVTMHETANGLALQEIESVFRSASDFLDAVSSSLQLDKLFSLPQIQRPEANVDLLGIGKMFSLTDYLRIPESMDPQKIIAKITEATTDALFNLPAVLTSQAWSKLSPAFLYSFEYFGPTSSGSNFLSGLPITSKPADKSKERIAHGDELGYLFDVRDMFGLAINGTELTNSTDIKVRNTFTSMIAQFIRSIPVDTANNITSNSVSSLFSANAAKGNSFIQVGQQAVMKNDFRFCELSVWGANLQPIDMTSCAYLVDQLTLLNTMLTNFTDNFGLEEPPPPPSLLEDPLKTIVPPPSPKLLPFF